jgi:hypothetical protein
MIRVDWGAFFRGERCLFSGRVGVFLLKDQPDEENLECCKGRPFKTLGVNGSASVLSLARYLRIRAADF